MLTLQVQSGGSFDVDYSVYGPNDKKIMEGEKERQGDFVFTAQNPGEYRFCFNNEMSTFADKMVDFEVAVCYGNSRDLAIADHMCSTGRRRIQIRSSPSESWLLTRTTFSVGRYDLQDQWAIEHGQQDAKIFPHTREPQLQHGSEYGAEDIQFQFN
jgi:hypothetical protein